MPLSKALRAQVDCHWLRRCGVPRWIILLMFWRLPRRIDGWMHGSDANRANARCVSHVRPPSHHANL
jgi:hypothetical protein